MQSWNSKERFEDILIKNDEIKKYILKDDLKKILTSDDKIENIDHIFNIKFK